MRTAGKTETLRFGLLGIDQPRLPLSKGMTAGKDRQMRLTLECCKICFYIIYAGSLPVTAHSFIHRYNIMHGRPGIFILGIKKRFSPASRNVRSNQVGRTAIESGESTQAEMRSNSN